MGHGNPLLECILLHSYGHATEAAQLICDAVHVITNPEALAGYEPDLRNRQFDFTLPSLIQESRATVIESAVNEAVLPSLPAAIQQLINQSLSEAFFDDSTAESKFARNCLKNLIQSTRGDRVLENSVNHALIPYMPDLLEHLANRGNLDELREFVSVSRGTSLERCVNNALIPVLPKAFHAAADFMPSPLRAMTDLFNVLRKDPALAVDGTNAIGHSLSSAFARAASPEQRENQSLRDLRDMIRSAEGTALEVTIREFLPQANALPLYLNNIANDGKGLPQLLDFIADTRETESAEPIAAALAETMPALFKRFANPDNRHTPIMKVIRTMEDSGLKGYAKKSLLANLHLMLAQADRQIQGTTDLIDYMAKDPDLLEGLRKTIHSDAYLLNRLKSDAETRTKPQIAQFLSILARQPFPPSPVRENLPQFIPAPQPEPVHQ